MSLLAVTSAAPADLPLSFEAEQGINSIYGDLNVDGSLVSSIIQRLSGCT